MNEQSSADVAQAAVYVYDLDTPDRWHSNQLEQLNQTVNDVEKVLAQNCAVLSQHEERLCSLLQRSEAIEMSVCTDRTSDCFFAYIRPTSICLLIYLSAEH
ncbi:hypothetical protein D915_006123 [Fasciola hepatica]|uniref:Uncharacterized protein n=1 Tax=Fasciola hepatica TaxID=6192 RepID=A0A4E0RXS8_FASHE|nr:hypothetical protein D915_006123 [Fasciola hepatica]